MGRRDDGIDRAIAGLHQGPRAGFVAARKALAARLQREGRPEDAARVRALAKPTLSAWAVSRLYAREPRAMRRLLEEGTAARGALRETLERGGAAALRDAIERVRRAGAGLTQRAAELVLEETGEAPSAAILGRVEVDLSALALSPSASEAAARGWIATDLDPPGLELLTDLPVARSDRTARRGAVATPRPRAERDAARDRATHARLDEEARRAEERAAELRQAAERAAKLAEDAHRRALRARAGAARHGRG